MKKAFIGIGGICANLGVSLADLEVYISIACSIIICIATLIATFKKAKSKTPKEIEIAQQDNNAEDRENNTSVEQSSNNNNNQVELEQQIIQTAHNIQELLNKRKGGGNNG